MCIYCIMRLDYSFSYFFHSVYVRGWTVTGFRDSDCVVVVETAFNDTPVIIAVIVVVAVIIIAAAVIVMIVLKKKEMW